MRTSQKKLWSSSLGFLNELPGMNICITNGHYTKNGGRSDILLVWNIYDQIELIFENSYLSSLKNVIFDLLDFFLFFFVQLFYQGQDFTTYNRRTIPTKFYN